MRRKQDSFDSVAVRNLNDIQEQEAAARPSRVSALVMASFGGACIVFAALALMRTPASEEPTDALDKDDVTFPGVLTDKDDPTTAMEVVRAAPKLPAAASDLEQLPRAQQMYEGPPPAADSLPVVPLPAQEMLGSVPQAKIAQADTLRNMAQHVTRETSGGEEAEAGKPGGYQLQVSSFKTSSDAEGFANVLRRRGHRAYVQQAHVKGRGLWHRVRIGPFRYKRSAEIYRQDFEAKERMVTFIVNPPKTRIRIVPSEGG